MNILIEQDLMLPMRDGVKLATDVYRSAEPGPRPVLLTRLPYGKETLRLILNQGDLVRMVQAGYAVVLQKIIRNAKNVSVSLLAQLRQPLQTGWR